MSLITCVVFTSPIPSHPSTAILVETVSSIRFHLPDAQIIIAFDGVRQEQRRMQDKYLHYMRNVADDPLFFQPNMKMITFADHLHQVGVLRRVLPLVSTPLIMPIEHDTPLVVDYVLPIKGICQAIQSEDVNSVRFLHEAAILPEHEYLTEGKMESHGVPLTRTKQFSARPHIASVEFYQKLLDKFSPHAKCFVEDYAHSVCQTAPWDEWKLSIYTPEGNQKRSYHTDGRSGGEKYDATQVF